MSNDPDYPYQPGQALPAYGQGVPNYQLGKQPADLGAVQQPRNNLGTLALVFGILSLPVAVLFFPIGLILAIAAIVLGILGMKRARRGEATNRGMALSGLIIGVLGLLLSAVILVIFIVAYNVASDCSDKLGHTPSKTELNQCIQDR